MKLSTNTDFTKLPRAGKILCGTDVDGAPVPFDLAVLAHDERHLRRKVVELVHGDKVFIDLSETVVLEHGDRLLLDDGRNAEIIAAEEELYEVLPSQGSPVRHLAWYLGSRHLAAQIEDDRILILRDHVIKAMLEGLGATVRAVREPFQPLHGAYHSQGHAHGHEHSHGHEHTHGHGERDAHGRLPGDPHYGHNHG